jgi:hypothetical protein
MKPTSVSTNNEWIKKTQYKCTIGFYSILKKKILPFALTWMNLKDNNVRW